MKNKKRLISILAIFSLILVVGIVYAATAGVLTFNGTVNLSTAVKLDIVNETASSGSTMTVSQDKQTATLTANPSEPGDTVTFSFKVQNDGNVDATIDSVVLTDVSGALVDKVTIGGSYGDLKDQTVTVGTTTADAYDITVTWDVGALNATGSDTFTIALDYSAATVS